MLDFGFRPPQGVTANISNETTSIPLMNYSTPTPVQYLFKILFSFKKITLDVGKPIEFLVTIGIPEKFIWTFFYIPELSAIGASSFDFHSSKFDQRTKFYICSELDGLVQIACKVISFTTWYTASPTLEFQYYLGGLSRNKKMNVLWLYLL